MKKPKRFQVKLSAEAQADIRKITQYLLDNDFDPAIAGRIRDTAAEKLSTKALSNPIYRKTDDMEIRKILVLRKNVVHYFVKDNLAVILQIRAGGMKERF